MTARELLEFLHSRPSAEFRFRGVAPWSCAGVRPRVDDDLGERTVVELHATASEMFAAAALIGAAVIIDPKTRAVARVTVSCNHNFRNNVFAIATIDMAPEQDLAVVELELVNDAA